MIGNAITGKAEVAVTVASHAAAITTTAGFATAIYGMSVLAFLVHSFTAKSFICVSRLLRY